MLQQLIADTFAGHIVTEYTVYESSY